MKTNYYIIHLETPADYQEVENLTREVFWNVYRPGCLEHYVLHGYRDREDFIPELDFVMEKDGKIIGHIMYVHAELHRLLFIYKYTFWSFIIFDSNVLKIL